MKKNENLQIWIFKEKQQVERETRAGRFVLAYQKKDCKKQPIIKCPYIYLYLSLLAEHFVAFQASHWTCCLEGSSKDLPHYIVLSPYVIWNDLFQNNFLGLSYLIFGHLADT